MKRRKRKPIPQFELSFKGEAFKLAGEFLTAPATPSIQKAPHANQLALFTETNGRRAATEDPRRGSVHLKVVPT
jgi:hypothetical protein